MRRLKRVGRGAIRHAGFALAVAALVAAHATPLRAAAAPRAERPVYHVGDKWPRTDGAWELTRIEKDGYVFSAGGDKEFHLTKDLGVTKIVLDGRTELDIDSPP
ncbi:MAG TPA: hypothetical protein VFD81_09805, partial [Methylomirabilota bacterium]|nr:hypothetical protein [Methylomirabilota bacterium]